MTFSIVIHASLWLRKLVSDYKELKIGKWSESSESFDSSVLFSLNRHMYLIVLYMVCWLEKYYSAAWTQKRRLSARVTGSHLEFWGPWRPCVILGVVYIFCPEGFPEMRNIFFIDILTKHYSIFLLWINKSMSLQFYFITTWPLVLFRVFAFPIK